MPTRRQDKNRCESADLNEASVRESQTHLIDGLRATRLARIFRTLSDPTRLHIISILSNNESCVCDLAAALGISQSAVSHQLRTMREMHLVRFRKEGRHVYYTLDDEHVRDLFQQGLAHIKYQ